MDLAPLSALKRVGPVDTLTSGLASIARLPYGTSVAAEIAEERRVLADCIDCPVFVGIDVGLVPDMPGADHFRLRAISRPSFDPAADEAQVHESGFQVSFLLNSFLKVAPFGFFGLGCFRGLDFCLGGTMSTCSHFQIVHMLKIIVWVWPCPHAHIYKMRT